MTYDHDEPSAVGDDLDRLLTDVGISGTDLGPPELHALWAALELGDETGFDDFTAGVARVCSAEWPDAVEQGELGLRLGQWRIDLTRAGIRTGMLSAIAAAALVERGLTEFGIAFATAVLPSVLDIERVELSAKSQRLLADLRLKPALLDGVATEDELYAALPDEARAVVNRYDFADFVRELLAAGAGSESGPGWIQIRPPAE